MRHSLNDYSKSAAQKGWGAGWPTCTAKSMTAVVVAPISGTRVVVHRQIARLVYLLIAVTEMRGYLLVPGQTWGGNCRAIAGTKTSSNHAWWIAVDIRSLTNPYVKKGRRVTDMPDWMVDLWNAFGWAWGGLYGDSMHYEFMGSPEDADDMTALAEQRLAPLLAGSPGQLLPTLEGPELDSEERRILEAAANNASLALWTVGQIKPNTDLLPAENAQTDILQWAANDMRQTLAGIVGSLAALGTAVQQLAAGGSVDSAEILRVAGDRAAAEVADSNRELAAHLTHMADLRNQAAKAIEATPPPAQAADGTAAPA